MIRPHSKGHFPFYLQWHGLPPDRRKSGRTSRPSFQKTRWTLNFFYHADGWLTLYNTQSLPTTDPPAVSKYDNPLHTTLSGKAPKSSIYYWKLSIAHKMYCWEIFWKPISRSLFLIGLPYWKIEGHTCLRRLLWFPNWFTWHFISTWKDEKLFCGKKNI